MTDIRLMRALLALPRRNLAFWLSIFFSPTVYFLLLVLADGLRLPAPPEIVVALLFYLVPAIALLVCELAVWSSSMTVARKVGWMLFTLCGMLLQFGILLAIVISGTGYSPTR